MSDMDYEKAWKDLKSHIEVLEIALKWILETQDAAITTKAILLCMEMIEKEMTTVLDDDDQQAQD